ncbi:hypothetical protein LTR28_003293 [Elasticomyces elasticus]|nr:hypothetical protein LTR28_003293 [Elasticomyces elasticus]
MDDAGDVTQDCQQDVDEEICAAAALEEDTKRWEDDRDDDLDDVAAQDPRVRTKETRRAGWLLEHTFRSEAW